MPASRLKQLAALHEERRRASRDTVDYATYVTRADGSRFEARLLDISAMGLHARVGEQFERDERVIVDLPFAGQVEAQVAWGLKGCFGGWFLTAIAPDVYARLLATLIRS